MLHTSKVATFLLQCKILEMKKVNKNKIQYDILNKNVYLDQHF